MSEVLRRQQYQGTRVLIETERVLNPQPRATLLYVTGGQVEMLRNLMAYLNRANTFVSAYGDGYYLMPTVGEWNSLQSIVASLEDMLMEVVLGFYDAYACVMDEKAQGVNGGTFTSGAWRTRDINTEQADTGDILTIASNQITLLAGTYRVLAVLPCFGGARKKARLYSVTDTSAILHSISAWVGIGEYGGHTILMGQFTITATKVLEIQHRTEQNVATLGLGVASNMAVEVYSVVEFWRET